MKSKQINFLIAPTDMIAIDEFLKKNNCLTFKRDTKELHNELNYDIVLNNEKIFQVYLCKEEYKELLSFEHIESKDYYYIDILKSYVIEFGIGGIYPYSDKILHRSRLYYIYAYYEDNKIVEKKPEYVAWADDLLKDFKKRFLKKAPELSDDFISENCINWIKENNAKPMPGGQKFVIE